MWKFPRAVSQILLQFLITDSSHVHSSAKSRTTTPHTTCALEKWRLRRKKKRLIKVKNSAELGGRRAQTHFDENAHVRYPNFRQATWPTSISRTRSPNYLRLVALSCVPKIKGHQGRCHSRTVGRRQIPINNPHDSWRMQRGLIVAGPLTRPGTGRSAGLESIGQVNLLLPLQSCSPSAKFWTTE